MSESLFFTCEEIDLNPRTSWAELLQIAFINKEQYFEYNEQTHYIYALCQDVEFNLKANALYIHITKPLKSNCPFSTITIQLPSTPINLEEVLQYLK